MPSSCIDICDLPSETGPCKGYFPRFFYNAESQTCESFIYGGCQGNGNNFESLKECEARCGGGGGKFNYCILITVEFCNVPEILFYYI